MPRSVDLRCEQHLHARLTERGIEVKCHQCTRLLRRPVFHLFDLATGERLDRPSAEEIAAFERRQAARERAA